MGRPTIEHFIVGDKQRVVTVDTQRPARTKDQDARNLEGVAVGQAIEARTLSQLLQLRVLCLGLLEDGNVRVGIFPKGEEILVRHAGFGGVA